MQSQGSIVVVRVVFIPFQLANSTGRYAVRSNLKASCAGTGYIWGMSLDCTSTATARLIAPTQRKD